MYSILTPSEQVLPGRTGRHADAEAFLKAAAESAFVRPSMIAGFDAISDAPERALLWIGAAVRMMDPGVTCPGPTPNRPEIPRSGDSPEWRRSPMRWISRTRTRGRNGSLAPQRTRVIVYSDRTTKEKVVKSCRASQLPVMEVRSAETVPGCDPDVFTQT